MNASISTSIENIVVEPVQKTFLPNEHFLKKQFNENGNRN